MRWLTLTALLLVASCGDDSSSDPDRADGPREVVADIRPDLGALPRESWACSRDLAITIQHPDGSATAVTKGHYDFKPSWSPAGSRLTFFRLTAVGAGMEFHTWRTKLAVVNTDGSGLRLLTSGEHPDFNPTWPRDGSNMIIFNRFSTAKALGNKIYVISPDGSPGDEVLISRPGADYEWADSTLKDGRIFVDRLEHDPPRFTSHLLRPKPGAAGTYEQIKRPTSLYWHKLSVSPSETRVAYMLDLDSDGTSYNGDVICIADFDVAELEIKKQKIITEYNQNHVVEYPRWSPDERHLVYDSDRSGQYQVYAYRLADGVTTRLSPDPGRDDQFANFKDLPK